MLDTLMRFDAETKFPFVFQILPPACREKLVENANWLANFNYEHFFRKLLDIF
jgi:hypothetical protein